MIRGVDVELRRGYCARCKCFTGVYWRRQIIASGAQMVYEVCLLKGRDKPHRLEKTGRNVAHAVVERAGVDLEDIPLTADNAQQVLCEVRGCTNVGVEVHHWAPTSIWGERDANNWPTGLLCKSHHEVWHTKTGIATGRPPAQK